MNGIFNDDSFEESAAASGIIKVYHHTEKPDGTVGQHEGPVGKCPAPECQWPRLGEMLTIPSGSTDRTGKLVRKGAYAVEIETADGKTYRNDIRSARKPEWGVYCPHGIKLVEAVPAEHTCHLPKVKCERSGEPGHLCIDHNQCSGCYPDGRKIRPWPCSEDGCTEADFDREQQEAEEAYYDELWQSYYG